MILNKRLRERRFWAIHGYFKQLAVCFFYPLFMGRAFLGTGNKAKMGGNTLYKSKEGIDHSCRD
jgi:hypothetical protein